MNKKTRIVLGHKGEHPEAVAYEELDAPVAAHKVTMLPLCEERRSLADIVPSLMPTLLGAERIFMLVPLLDNCLFTASCMPRWTGEFPCAKCVFERYLMLLGYEPATAEGLVLRGPSQEDDVYSGDKRLNEFMQKNAPAFSFDIATDDVKSLGCFNISRAPVAVAVMKTVIVQNRGRSVTDEEVELLHAIRLPREKRHRIYDDQDILEIEEAADYLGMAKGTVYNWVAQGRIPHIKLGGRVKFMFGAVRKWLESQAFEPTISQDDDSQADEEFLWNEDEDS